MRRKAQLLVVLFLLLVLGDPVEVARKVGAKDVMADGGNSRHFAALHRTGDISEPSPQAKTRILGSYGNLPLRFEQNQGQFDQPVKFLSRGSGYSLFLTSSEAVLSLRNRQQSGVDQSGPPESKKENTGIRAATLRIGLVGDNPAPTVVGMEELTGKSNYFIGNDPHKWRTNVPNYAKVKYKEVYPGIDLVYYGNQGQLEFDFIVAAAVSPSPIGLRFDGAEKVEVDAGGDLIVEKQGVQVRLKKPVAYQETEEGREEVACAFSPAGDRRVGFKLGAFDSARPLVIDPVLLYSTYLGGNGNDRGHGIAVDSSGSAYITGSTRSSNFPTANAVQTGFSDGTFDAFVTKLNPAGSALVYSTYLGTSKSDTGWGIAVDSSGSAYVTGITESSNFPTANAVQAVFGGNFDAFVTKLNPAGSALVYSTFLGGSSSDSGRGIAVDSSGSVYVTGYTYSSNFPTLNAVQAGLRSVNTNAFVTKLNPAGSALVYSTYLGGNIGESGADIAVDSSGSAYVTGSTCSTNFPTANALQAGYRGGCINGGDAFVTKLNPAGSALVYSTYLGGSDGDSGVGIAVDSSGSAYITGGTYSSNFPTANAVQAGYGGGNGDAFVTKLNPAGSALIYSTFLGGSDRDDGVGIAVDLSGSAYITGIASGGFPVANTVQAGYGGGGDAFVTKLNPAGSALIYSTFLGGSDRDDGVGIAVDLSGSAYITGITGGGFPVAHTVQPVFGGDTADAFVTKLGEEVPCSCGASNIEVPLAYSSNPQIRLLNDSLATSLALLWPPVGSVDPLSLPHAAIQFRGRNADGSIQQDTSGHIYWGQQLGLHADNILQLPNLKQLVMPTVLEALVQQSGLKGFFLLYSPGLANMDGVTSDFPKGRRLVFAGLRYRRDAAGKTLRQSHLFLDNPNASAATLTLTLVTPQAAGAPLTQTSQLVIGANAAIFTSIDNLVPLLLNAPAGYDLPAGTHLVVDGVNQLHGMTVFENGQDSIATTKAIVPELPASEAAASSRTLFAPFISLSRPPSQTELERFDTILSLYNGDPTDASLTVQALSPTGQPLFSNGSEIQLVLKAGQQLTIPVLKRGAADGLFSDDLALTGQDPRNGYLKIVMTRRVSPFGFVGSVNVHGFVALKFAGANETIIPLESNGTSQAYYLHVAHNPGQGPYRMALALLNPTDTAIPVKVEVFETNAASTPEERARLGRPTYVGRIDLNGHEQVIKFLDQLINDASVVAGQPKPPMTSQLGGYIRLTSENPAVPLLTFCTYFVVEDGAGFVVKSLSSIEGQRVP